MICVAKITNYLHQLQQMLSHYTQNKTNVNVIWKNN